MPTPVKTSSSGVAMIFDVFGCIEFDQLNTKEKWIKSCEEYDEVYGESNRTKVKLASKQPKVARQGNKLVVIR